jgi:hypothetical protein
MASVAGCPGYGAQVPVLGCYPEKAPAHLQDGSKVPARMIGKQTVVVVVGCPWCGFAVSAQDTRFRWRERLGWKELGPLTAEVMARFYSAELPKEDRT